MCRSEIPQKCHPLALHPDWHLYYFGGKGGIFCECFPFGYFFPSNEFVCLNQAWAVQRLFLLSKRLLGEFPHKSDVIPTNLGYVTGWQPFSWWRRMIRKKTFWWFKFPWWPFFGYFSKRLPYIGSNTCPVSQVLRKYAGNAFKATQQPRYPFYRAHAPSHQQTPWAVALRYRCFGQGAWERPYALPAAANVVAGTVRMPKVWSCETLKNSKMSMKALHLFNKKHATSHKFIWQKSIYIYTYI